jgi:hypothetical protein
MNFRWVSPNAGPMDIYLPIVDHYPNNMLALLFLKNHLCLWILTLRFVGFRSFKTLLPCKYSKYRLAEPTFKCYILKI